MTRHLLTHRILLRSSRFLEITMAHDDTTPGTEAGSARVHELDVDQARESLHEMAAVVRTIFGVNLDAPLQPAEDPQPFVVDDPSDDWSETALPAELPADTTYAETTQVPLDAPAAALETPIVELPTVETPTTASPLTGDAPPVPQTAALTSVPVPSALPVEGIAVTPPGVATPMAASPLPASVYAAAQPGEAPAAIPMPAVPVAVLLPPAPVTPVTANASAATDEPAEDTASVDQPQTPDRHSMALLHEIAFLDD